MSLTVSELAKIAGVNTDTVRFYEKKGLLASPPRSSSGYRKYPEEAVTEIRFIRRAKDIGFTLDEIAELLSLSPQSTNSCKQVQENAIEKLAEIKQRILDLRRMERALKKLVSECKTEGGIMSGCPLLKALGD